MNNLFSKTAILLLVIGALVGAFGGSALVNYAIGITVLYAIVIVMMVVFGSVEGQQRIPGLILAIPLLAGLIFASSLTTHMDWPWPPYLIGGFTVLR